MDHDNTPDITGARPQPPPEPREAPPAMDATTLELTRGEARLFVGSNGDYYERKWFGDGLDHPRDWSINGAALLFVIPWMAYRKMYRELMAFLVASNIITIVIRIAMVYNRVPVDQREAVSSIVWLLFSLLVGAQGNRLYRKKALRAKVQALKCPPEQQTACFVRQGGSSVCSAIVTPIAAAIVSRVLLFVVVYGYFLVVYGLISTVR